MRKNDAQRGAKQREIWLNYLPSKISLRAGLSALENIA